MEINAIGMPTNRPAPIPPSTATESTETKSVTTADPTKVNTAKSTLPDGVGNRVDKTA